MTQRREFLRKTAELAIMFGSLAAVDSMLLAGDAFAGIEPNPLWLPVLVFAMCYGTGMGLAAATIASIIWILAPHQLPAGSDQIDEQYHLSLLPLLWTMTALLIGEVTANRMAQYDKLRRRHAELSADWEKAALTFADLSKTNRELQVRIASDQHMGGQALASAAGLLQSDQASQTEALTRLIAIAVQSDDFTYYQVRGERFVALLQGASARGRPIDLSHTRLAHAMTKQMRTIHAGQERGRAQLQDFGIAAIPVRDEQNGELMAILVIHASDELQFNAAKLAEFAQISRAIARYSPILARPHTINLVDYDFIGGRVA